MNLQRGIVTFDLKDMTYMKRFKVVISGHGDIKSIDELQQLK